MGKKGLGRATKKGSLPDAAGYTERGMNGQVFPQRGEESLLATNQSRRLTKDRRDGGDCLSCKVEHKTTPAKRESWGEEDKYSENTPLPWGNVYISGKNLQNRVEEMHSRLVLKALSHKGRRRRSRLGSVPPL